MDRIALSRRTQPDLLPLHLLHFALPDPAAWTLTSSISSPLGAREKAGLVKFIRNEKLKNLRSPRDRAIFLLMLRSGLRVEEVANLTLEAIDLRRDRLLIQHGKGGKDRVV